MPLGFEPISGGMIAGAGWPISYHVNNIQAITLALASLRKSTSKPFSTNTTPAPWRVRFTHLYLKTTTTLAPHLLRHAAKLILAYSAPAPSLHRNANKLARTTTAPMGRLGRLTSLIRRATTEPAPTILRGIGLILQAATTPAASLRRPIIQIALRVMTAPRGRMFWCWTEILRGRSNRTVNLTGDSHAASTQLGGAANRSESLKGDIS